MVTIDQALQRVKGDVAELLSAEAIHQACRLCGHTWRERLLDPAATIHLFIQQIIHGNTACTHVARLADACITGPAYCTARMRLPLEALQLLVEAVGATCQRDEATHLRDETTNLWHGHRTWLIDGSGFSMPDTSVLQKQFGQPGAQKKGCGFPVAHLLAMFDAHTGLLRETIVAPLRTQDLSLVTRLHPLLQPNDVLVGDRGFCSYAHLALILQGSHHAVLRLHQRQHAGFVTDDAIRTPQAQRRTRVIESIRPNDQIVEWTRPDTPPLWMRSQEFEKLPLTLRVRLVRYRIHRPARRTREITLATTLLDAEKYPAAALRALYATRWDVEVNFRHLKITMNMDVLKCKSVEGVMKEVLAFVLVYNLARLVMCEAARRQKVKVKRLSFIDALRWLMHAQGQDALDDLIVLPDRPNRVEPRVMKRRKQKYPLMTEPRHVLRQRILQSPLTG